MAKIKGICKNIDGDCSLAFNKTVQEAEKDDFVCSECGEPLKEVTGAAAKPAKSNSKLVPIVAGAAVLLAAVGGTGYFMGWFGSSDETATEETVIDSETSLTETEEPADTVTGIVSEETATEATAETTDTPEVKPPTVTDGRRNLGYGYYEGEYPTGTGIITMTRDHTFETVSGPVEAKAGETIVSVKFKDGKLIQGELHRADGSRPFLSFGAM